MSQGSQRSRSSNTMPHPHHIKRRTLIQYLALASMLGQAQASSLKDIRIVSPYPAGASVDFWARHLETELRNRLAVDTMVVYMPGASGVIAANQVRRISTNSSPALLIASTTLFSQMPKLADSGLNFDPNQAFQPISILWQEPFYLAVKADSPIQSLDDLLARSRRPQTAPSFGTTGSQTSGGLLMEHVGRRHALAWTHVPYKGMAEVSASLLGGHTELGVVSLQSIRKLVEAGKIRLLATTGKKRSKSFPNCPSLREAKVLDIDGSVWFGLFATNELHPAIVSSIQTAVSSLLSNEEFHAEALANGFTPLGISGSEAHHFIRESNKAWAQVISNS